MFEWLVAIVNESLAGENGDAAERAEMFIGVLDIYGFEHFQKVRTRVHFLNGLANYDA
jgi:myosin-5